MPDNNLFTAVPADGATLEERKRMEIMFDLNKWANNDNDIARAIAQILVDLLITQFDLRK